MPEIEHTRYTLLELYIPTTDKISLTMNYYTFDRMHIQRDTLAALTGE
jgi:hypothetical protein